jgi:hypothetical protein
MRMPTGGRPIWSLALALIMVGVLAPSIAGEEAGWKEVELIGAQGVPRAQQHRYEFRGVLVVAETTSKESGFSLSKGGYYTTVHNVQYAMWVEAVGTYDTHTQTAVERITLTGDLVGNIISTIKAPNDPWLNHGTQGVVLDVSMNTSTNGVWPRFDSLIKQTRQPLTIYGADPSNAAALSAQAASNNPPPPPPPPAPDKVREVLSSWKAGNMSLSGPLVPMLIGPRQAAPAAGQVGVRGPVRVGLNPQPEPPIWSGELSVQQFEQLYTSALRGLRDDQGLKMKVELRSDKALTPQQAQALRDELRKLGLEATATR